MFFVTFYPLKDLLGPLAHQLCTFINTIQGLLDLEFRHAKGKSMVNFYIVNALGQNLANSESCPILRLL